jgi:gamma-glutamyl-gamma-aminobutyrate hydrolase PuuD
MITAETLRNEMARKVLLVNDRADMGRSYYLPFQFIGPRVDDPHILIDDPQSVALAVFTGGADVSPEFYNEPVGKFTHIDPQRDENEFAVFNYCMEHDIPMFGICRGLQFLTVMFGGKLIQHVTGHHKRHLFKTPDGMEFEVSSSHHQMVVPRPEDKILGWAAPRLSTTYLDGSDNEQMQPFYEVEAVKFHKAKAVGVQYHPEIMPKDSHGFHACEDLIRRYLPTAAD